MNHKANTPQAQHFIDLAEKYTSEDLDWSALQLFLQALLVQPDCCAAVMGAITICRHYQWLTNADKILESYLSLVPDDGFVRSFYAMNLFEMGRYEQAVEHSGQALSQDHGLPLAHYAMGASLVFLGEVGQGVPHLRSAVIWMCARYGDEQDYLWNALGVGYVHLGQRREAGTCFARALNCNRAFNRAAANLEMLTGAANN